MTTQKKPLPLWLRRELEANPDALVGRIAHVRTCRRCGVAIWRGRDATVFVEADFRPISQVGEVLALAAGRGTYDLHDTYDGLELCHRNVFRIRAGAFERWPVVARHVCGALALPQQPGTILDKTDRPGVDRDGPPPF